MQLTLTQEFASILCSQHCTSCANVLLAKFCAVWRALPYESDALQGGWARHTQLGIIATLRRSCSKSADSECSGPDLHYNNMDKQQYAFCNAVCNTVCCSAQFQAHVREKVCLLTTRHVASGAVIVSSSLELYNIHFVDQLPI